MAHSDLDLNVEVKNDFHLGHIILNCLKIRQPEDICFIDGATDEKETYKSVLHRTVNLAKSLRNFGLKPGDIIAISGLNHVTLLIPLYAGCMNGMPVVGVDPKFKSAEIETLFKMTKPKIVFCNEKTSEMFKQVAKDLDLELTIITFHEGNLNMEAFIEKYNDEKPIADFVPATFDIKKIYAWLVTTSGVTGVPKVAAIDHKTAVYSVKDFISVGAVGTFVQVRPQKSGLMLPTVQCMTINVCAFGMPLVNTIVLMTSDISGVNVIVDIVNKYKPSYFPISPSFVDLMLKCETYCDFTCFDNISIGGDKIYKDMLIRLKSRIRKDTEIQKAYGCTEAMGVIILSIPGDPIGSCGTVIPGRQVKLVDGNGNDIEEPYVTGELLYKGPMFSEYYKNPEETANVLTKDGWLKTGDELYRDDNGFYYYVARKKMIMKFRGVHISPTELEEVISTHPGVSKVCVTGIDHPTDGTWPVACVVKEPGVKVTAQDIKDIVTENLSESKELRGGVIFMEELPKTSTGKTARMKLKEYVVNAIRE